MITLQYLSVVSVLRAIITPMYFTSPISPISSRNYSETLLKFRDYWVGFDDDQNKFYRTNPKDLFHYAIIKDNKETILW